MFFMETLLSLKPEELDRVSRLPDDLPYMDSWHPMLFDLFCDRIAQCHNIPEIKINFSQIERIGVDRMQRLARALTNCRQFKKATVEVRIAKLSPEGKNIIFNFLKDLTTLEIIDLDKSMQDCTAPVWQQLFDNLIQLRNLNTLDLYSSTIKKQEIPCLLVICNSLPLCTKLQNLTFPMNLFGERGESAKIKLEAYGDCIAKCTSLSSLSLKSSHLQALGIESFVAFCIKFMQSYNLRRIDVSGAFITKQQVQALYIAINAERVRAQKVQSILNEKTHGSGMLSELSELISLYIYTSPQRCEILDSDEILYAPNAAIIDTTLNSENIAASLTSILLADDSSSSEDSDYNGDIDNDYSDDSDVELDVSQETPLAAPTALPMTTVVEFPDLVRGISSDIRSFSVAPTAPYLPSASAMFRVTSAMPRVEAVAASSTALSSSATMQPSEGLAAAHAKEEEVKVSDAKLPSKRRHSPGLGS